MNYPYGQPGNPGYGGYPPQGYAQQGFPPRKPGGGTAITAGVLAAVHGVLAVAVMVVGIIGIRKDLADNFGDGVKDDIVALSISTLIAAVFLSGAILLFSRRRAGQIIVITATSLIMVGGAGWVIFATLVLGAAKGAADFVDFMVLVVFVLELLTLCMATMSSTGRWIEARTARAHGAGMYSPQPQYPYYGP